MSQLPPRGSSFLKVQQAPDQFNKFTDPNLPLPIVMNKLPITTQDRLYGRVVCQTGGSLDKSKNAYAGTSGGNGFEQKLRKLI
jgi:hypothetical protein